MSFKPNQDNRIAEAEKFFNLLYGNVTERKFGYLWAKQGETKATYPSAVSNPEERREMARKAIELSDAGFDVYYGINLGDEPPKGNKRYKAEQVTLQTATVTDIDVEGGTHISNKKCTYPPTFDAAKSFLPFDVSLLVDSGYGMHGLCIYVEPIAVTVDNRAACEERNEKFLDVIRSRAGIYAKAVDGVGDLPRILRVPGTFNYKLGRDNAPLCKLVDVSTIRFTPADLDERLNALAPAQGKEEKKPSEYPLFDTHDFDIWRAQKMLEVIPVAALAYDDWINIGIALKGNGNSCSDWEQWSRADERFKEGECESKWSGFDGDLTIATICDIAKQYGYDAKETYRQWQELHPELSSSCSEKADVMKEISHDFTPQSEPHYESESKDRFTRDFIEDCPINLRLPHFFSFREWGITQIIPPKKEKDETKYICVSRTPIVPTKKFREPIKGTVEYEFAFLSDGKWRTVEVDGATLGDTRTMKKFLRYHDVLIEDAVKLSSFFNALIALNSPDMPKIKSYNQTGWTNDDCEEFAYPSANSTAVIRRVGYDYDKIFKPRGDKEAWKEKFLEVTKQGSAQAHVIIGAACAAPLIKPLEDLPNLQVHVWGKKSIGKTPMLKFAVSIFGNTDVDKLTHTFAATPKSRLETACAFNDLPLICEELESIGAKDAEKLSTDIYNFFLGIGGQALKRDGTKRAAKLFNSTRLTCGEHSLVQSYGNGGEFKRVLDLRCARLLNEDFASDLYSFCKRNYGLFGEQWIQYIIDNRDEISKDYHILLDAVKDGQRKRGNENDLTQLRTLVISAVAYQHFKVCIGLQDCLNLVDCANDLDEIIETLPTVDEIDDTTRAIEALRSWVAAHDKSFIRDMKTDTGTTEEISSYTPYSCGKISDNGEVLFYPTELKKILEDELHFTSAAKLISEWKDRGDILITDAGRTTHQTRVKKKRTRVIHFRPNVISSDEDSDEAEYYETLDKEGN